MLIKVIYKILNYKLIKFFWDAWHATGQRFDPAILHTSPHKASISLGAFCFLGKCIEKCKDVHQIYLFQGLKYALWLYQYMVLGMKGQYCVSIYLLLQYKIAAQQAAIILNHLKISWTPNITKVISIIHLITSRNFLKFVMLHRIKR